MYGKIKIRPGNIGNLKIIFVLLIVALWYFIPLLFMEHSAIKHSFQLISGTRGKQQQEYSSQGRRLKPTIDYNRVIKAARNDRLKYIATLLTNNLTQLEQNADCKVTLSCGHSNDCGLGCQLHHRSLCLFMSYTLRIPMIHDAKGSWPYSDPWETVFYPLGSDCVPGKGTIYVTWQSNGCPLLNDGGLSSTLLRQQMIPYPLKNGLPLEKSIKSMLTDSHPLPFMWLVGFLLSYTMALRPEFIREYEKWRSQLLVNSSKPIIGIHVRRTDKITEEKDSYHTIDEYIRKAETFFQNSDSSRTLYVASDDTSVLQSFRQNYTLPRWNIIGQKYVKSRLNGLAEIVKDVLFLTEADYVVCGLSSNICRLVHELRNYRDKDAINKLVSMDGVYNYPIYGSGDCRYLPTKIL